MRESRGKRGGRSLCCLGLLFLFCWPSFSVADDCLEWVAKAVSVQGMVQVQREGTAAWEAVVQEHHLCAGDILRVLADSRAALVLRNEAVIRLDEKTTLTITPEAAPKALLLRLLEGAVHFFSRIQRSLHVATPFVNGAVEGTEFFVRVEETRTYFSVFRGRVRIDNAAGELLLADNTTATAAQGQAPVLKTVARPRDAVHWALYYPAIVFEGEEATTHQLVSASKLLSVGQVEAAREQLGQIITDDPNNSDALAIRAIIELVQNRKEAARSYAEKAFASDSRSAMANMALAYVQQAFFDVEAAREILSQAVSYNPQNALLWARLSELWLATGYQDKALAAAKRATALSPNDSRSQTVLGFAYISQVKIDGAKAAFAKSIELDQADPLPRLGLGLALIRDGDLRNGREQIEIAAALDPGNSTVRSYLGKAFYEEKKNAMALRQYEVAKELDPNDPTPFFYDAIRKQSINRPVEALYDLHKSIALNGNRAVYRSQLLLDEDIAARSASLGRIYRNIGFEQVALVEGWKSVNTDPGNYSAHRFLSDTYAALPRHEIARVSELLQAQLLQPININPVQPQLAESTLSIFEGSGPGEPSYNEFNSLFARNRLVLNASGVIGGNETWGNELVHSGLLGRISYSLGQFHYESKGFRENNDQEKDIYNAFIQAALSNKTSVQAELRYKDTEEGDLYLQFFPDNFSPDLRESLESQSGRFGFHHAFSPKSDLIGSVIYQDDDAEAQLPMLYIEGVQQGYNIEIQQQYRSNRINLTGGIGHFDSDFETTARRTITIPPNPPTEVPITDNYDFRHSNFYLYSHINYPDPVILTLGASVDNYYDEFTDYEVTQYNPKIGIIWNLSTDTVIRAACFRTLKRNLMSDQTIEPTQIAGFNQFYDEFNGTDSWLYGIAIDHKFSQSLFGGVALSKRKLSFPFNNYDIDPINPPTDEAEFDDESVRVYLYWASNKWVTTTAEFQFENFKTDPDYPEFYSAAQFMEVKTYRFPLGINFIHACGFYANLKPIYVYQKGEFGSSTPGQMVEDNDSFWVVNANVGYRLPKRFGIISVEAKNLFDTDFNYFELDASQPQVYPEQVVIAKVTLSF